MGTVGALHAHHSLSTRALSSAHVTTPCGHSASGVTHTRQAAQGVALLQGVVTVTTSITEMTLNVYLRQDRKRIHREDKRKTAEWVNDRRMFSLLFPDMRGFVCVFKKKGICEL